MAEPTPEVAIGDRRVDARRNYEHIVDVATEVLAENPAATLQDIAQTVGLHRATLHRHFRSREDLMEALRRRASRRLLAVLDEIDRSNLEPAVAVETFVRRMLAGAVDESLWRFGTYYGGGSDEFAAEVRERLITLMASGQHAGVLRTDLAPDRLAAVWGGVGYAMLPLMHHDGISFEEAVGVILLTMGMTVRPPRPAAPPAAG